MNKRIIGILRSSPMMSVFLVMAYITGITWIIIDLYHGDYLNIIIWICILTSIGMSFYNRVRIETYSFPILVRTSDGKKFKPAFSYQWNNHLTHPVDLIALDESETVTVHCHFYYNCLDGEIEDFDVES